MDKLKTYREIVRRPLLDWEAYVRRARHNGIEVQHIFDEENDQYLLMYLGWDKDRRVRDTLLHVRLRDGKIWIEADETEEGLANELVRAGVPPQDIVLAFHPPQLRPLTEFAST